MADSGCWCAGLMAFADGDDDGGHADNGQSM